MIKKAMVVALCYVMVLNILLGLEVVTAVDDTWNKISDAVVLLRGTSKIIKNGERTFIDEDAKYAVPTMIGGVLYIPAQFVAEACGGNLKWNTRTNKILIENNSARIEALAENKEIFLNDAPKTMSAPFTVVRERVYAPARELVGMLRYQYYENENGLIIISANTNSFPTNDKSVKQLWELASYTRPTAREILDDLKTASPNNQHPRILLNNDEFNQLQEQRKTDAVLDQMCNVAVRDAEGLLSSALPEYTNTNSRLLSVARSTLSSLQNLSLAYRLTGDTRFAQKAWEIMEAACSFESWHEQAFLDTAEISAAVAIGFDWCYDYLTDEQRQFITQRVKFLAFDKVVPVYDGSIGYRSHNRSGWLFADHNWNSVCNGGIAMISLAFADEPDMSEIAAYCLESGLKSMEHFLPSYAPDGASGESPVYWSYGTRYYTMYMASLKSALGTEYGYYYAPGVNNTMLFGIAMAPFNFGDSEEGFGNVAGDVITLAEFSMFAGKMFNDTTLSDPSTRSGFYGIIYYVPRSSSKQSPYPLDVYFGKHQLITMRSGWNDKKAINLSTKGGDQDVNHGHNDFGSFIFDANGVRWAEDLGADNYSLPGYMTRNHKQWYRQRTEGHNTLFINPGLAPEGKAGSYAEATLVSKPAGSIATVDMTDFYSRDAESIRRGFWLHDNRTKVIVRDEIKLKSEQEIYWFMHTKANIELMENGKAALLSRMGERCYVRILTDNMTFDVMEAKPHPLSQPWNPLQYSNAAYKKLAIHLTDIKETDITVELIPLEKGSEIPIGISQVGDIDTWEIPYTEPARVQSIMIGNREIEGFSPDKFNYTVKAETPTRIPRIRAEGARVIHAQSIPGTTYIIAGKGNNTQTYRVAIAAPAESMDGNSRRRYDLSISEYSIIEEAHNPPEHSLDGNIETRWASKNEQYITYDIGRVVDIGAVAVAVYQGAVRNYKMSIDVSADGVKWETTWMGETSGTTGDLEMYAFETQKARYVKVTGYGNSVNTWNNFAEVQVFGAK